MIRKGLQILDLNKLFPIKKNLRYLRKKGKIQCLIIDRM